MPTMDWGLEPGTVEDFDRSKVFVPYKGKLPPPNQVFLWEIKRVSLVKGTSAGKLPQLRIGLELCPRNREEKQYEGFYRSTFSPVSESTAFRYVPFLDAIGVSERDFLRGTKHDREGVISAIGRWKFKPGETFVLARLEESENYKDPAKTDLNINDTWFGAPTDADFEEEEDDDDEYEDDESYDDADDDDDDEDEDEDESDF